MICCDRHVLGDAYLFLIMNAKSMTHFKINDPFLKVGHMPSVIAVIRVQMFQCYSMIGLMLVDKLPNSSDKCCSHPLQMAGIFKCPEQKAELDALYNASSTAAAVENLMTAAVETEAVVQTAAAVYMLMGFRTHPPCKYRN